ncbi:MAG: oxygen-independent coproporphyrinogen III oxidase [Lachnospiraceae bacterium]|nr:oxygen-independent coproporphyrinogen III oxidase [Lachnospiraceae bacterium]
MKSLSIYIHIPFCVQKCKYCDFLSAPSTPEARAEYLEALKREMIKEAPAYQDYEVKTVFFGGGTPSILEAGQISECMDVLKEYYRISADAEISMEMNPGTASPEKLRVMKRSGINRLSIGLQSAVDEELRMLGRIHTYAEFENTYYAAREAGFTNINIDLMSAIPGQSVEGWRKTLQRAVDLKPEHISAYSLIIEEGTPLFENIESYPAIPDEEEDRIMYQDTKSLLKKQGYERYEISNYAKPGYECKHNVVYWTRENYAGFGLGAASMVENVRWKNTDDMTLYLRQQELKEEVQKLSKAECMEEFMYLGLRMMDGVSCKKFADAFDISMDDVYGDVLKRWGNMGVLECDGEKVTLTDAGIDVSNQIFADFLLEENV